MPDRISSQLVTACVFFLLYRVVTGASSCTQWGQSCWGGLGKRSEGTTDWFLARLLSQRPPAPQMDDRNIFGPENVVRGPVSANMPQITGQAALARLDQDEGIPPLAVWRTGDDEAVNTQEAWTKMRLYQLLSG